MKAGKTSRVVALALMLALTVTGVAAAKKPVPYQGVAGKTQALLASGGTPSSTPAPTVSTLPFTGIDLGLFAVGGLVLVAAGYSLNRRGRHRSS
jgi:hypothetical protein